MKYLYHATTANFDAFDHNASGLGTHFGTRRAAEWRAAHILGQRGRRWRLLRVGTAIANPLRMDDALSWDSEADVEAALLRAGVMQRADYRETRKLSGPEFWRWARRRIEALGYDAVVYENRVEHKGSDSFILWNNDLIRSVRDVKW